jgi:capsular polysaccharide export protein
MIVGGLEKFKGKRVVLLQGPVGPFFRRLAKDLAWAGAFVCKINFNGGDWLFFPDNATAFTGTPDDWPLFFHHFLLEKKIDSVFLFGDCRPIHTAAHAVATKLGLDIGVFEEGYIRPDYVTFERSGVNALSSLPKAPLAYLNGKWEPDDRAPLPVGHPFRLTALWAILYYAASHALRPFFPHYQHHRPLKIWEGLYWLRGFWRRRYYRRKERNIEEKLSGQLSGKYFLAPLQVPIDSQVQIHSGYSMVEDFIADLIRSFATHSAPDDYLVFKHHPLDRGYHDHTRLIAKLAKQHHIPDRVLYIHDQPLPVLIEHARGVVVINSTVGFSAIHHGRPVKTCGTAFYDMLGLTFQGPLEDFWSQADAYPPDPELYRRFRSFIIQRTQLNGNFYRRLPIPGMAAGLVWPSPAPQAQAVREHHETGVTSSGGYSG